MKLWKQRIINYGSTQNNQAWSSADQQTRLLPRPLCAASSTFPSKILNPAFTPPFPHPTPLRKIPISKMSDQEKEPTPAELAAREVEEKQRKAAEEAEQAALPYKWTQTIRDVDVTIPVPGTLKGRDLDVSLKRDSIRVAVKGQEAVIEVCSSPCLHMDSAVPSYLPGGYGGRFGYLTIGEIKS